MKSTTHFIHFCCQIAPSYVPIESSYFIYSHFTNAFLRRTSDHYINYSVPTFSHSLTLSKLTPKLTNTPNTLTMPNFSFALPRPIPSSRSIAHSPFTPSICNRSHVQTPQRSNINWSRIRDVALATAIATLITQIPAVPMDLASKMIKKGGIGAPTNLPSALFRLFTNSPFQEAYKHFGISCLKCVPTKALSAALYELSCQNFIPKSNTSSKHIPLAIASAAMAITMTFPLHTFYFASKKGFAASAILSSFSRSPAIMYSGFLPALLATTPSTVVSNAVYKNLRTNLDNVVHSRIPFSVWTIGAASAASLCASSFAEPLKQVSRRMALQSVRASSSIPMLSIAGPMLENGPGEFFSGYKFKLTKNFVTAFISKTVVKQVKKGMTSSTIQPLLLSECRKPFRAQLLPL